MERNYFGAIEFGACYTTCVVVSYFQNKMNVVASCMVPTNGYYDGTITDNDAFLATIESVVNEISRKYKINLDEVILVLPNNNHRIYSAYVSNKVLTERQIIGKQQVDAIRNQIKSAKVNDGEILVEEVPTKYTLDGERALRSAPINYQSSILAIESNVHTLPRFVVESLKNALTEANVNVLGVVVNCNCAAFATTEQYGLENACIHINVGQESTTISSFAKGFLIKSTTLNFGFETLVSKLAHTLKVEKEFAKELFESYFVANVDYASDVVFDEERNLSEKRISGIVLNNVYNGFNLILEECEKLVKDPSSKEQVTYLLTGWLNDYEFFYEEFSKYTETSVKKGDINVIGLSSQAYVNCYGALLYYLKNNKDLIESKFENDEDFDVTKAINRNGLSSNETSSRFKDIFDD